MPTTDLHRLRPGKLDALASLLALVAGILALLSVWSQHLQADSMTFWLRLLMGIGFITSAVLRIVARTRINREIHRQQERDQP